MASSSSSSSGYGVGNNIVARGTSLFNNSSISSVRKFSPTSPSPETLLYSSSSFCRLQSCNNIANNDNNSNNNNVDDVPQWKKDLIERRKQQNQQQNKVFAGSVRSPTTTNNFSTISGVVPDSLLLTGVAAASSNLGNNCNNSSKVLNAQVNTSVLHKQQKNAKYYINSNNNNNMRLEAEASPLLLSPEQQQQYENLKNGRAVPREPSNMPKRPESIFHNNNSNKSTARFNEMKNAKLDIELPSKKANSNEDAESDSSEELQYGPGIVHKLRSKYLNLTLREMNRSRPSVQCFRRATSLEDLLDHQEESPEKVRKYAKKNNNSTAIKAERYRSVARGNDSMKRSKSVETLLRCNSIPEENSQKSSSSYFNSNIFKQENDHIILVDRTSVKIENRLMDKDRIKFVNKPRRIKPVLADTERPPPDLVRTTMRFFESSSIKKLKPKGEVAAKVATFKTINDTFKAQNQKKIFPKPPLYPKPSINGNSSSPKKVILAKQSTAELIEKSSKQEPCHRDGVITDPIVQSVSSVVSKFQQIEKSQTPSPEPSFNRLKFSPVPSPEPYTCRSKITLDIKSPTIATPVPNSRISPPKTLTPITPKVHSPLSSKVQSPLSPKIQSPTSPNSELFKYQSSLTKKLQPPTNINNKEELVNNSVLEIANVNKSQKDDSSIEQAKMVMVEAQNDNDELSEEDPKDNENSASEDNSPTETFNELAEVDYSPRTVSKSALDNISKAGITIQYSFSDSPTIKSYLPSSPNSIPSSPDQAEDLDFDKPEDASRYSDYDNNDDSLEEQITPPIGDLELNNTGSFNLQQEPPSGNSESKKISFNTQDRKRIGAISSLGLIKSSIATTYSQGNESKTIKCQKTETSPPQKQIGIIRPLVSTKTQLPQQNLSNRELEKNLINRVKSIEQPTKVLVSLKSAEEIQPVKKNNGNNGGLWESTPWNQQNNTMVFNFSNRKDVPDYIENDGLIVRRKRKSRSGDNNVIVTNLEPINIIDDSETEFSGGPPSPCDVTFSNDNVLINGRSNLSRTPRNHKHRIQFDDTATRTFEYPSESSMLENEGIQASAVTTIITTNVVDSGDDSSSSASVEHLTRSSPTGGLASFTPSKIELASEGFELGVTRATISTLPSPQLTSPLQPPSLTEVDYLKPSQDAGTWGQETAADMLY